VQVGVGQGEELLLDQVALLGREELREVELAAKFLAQIGLDLRGFGLAGAHRAAAVLAMLSDDSENAFVVLAVKELAPGVRTLAAVNDAHHLSRVKLAQPDVVIAPQVLGGELTAMLLSGEQVTPDFVMQRVFLNAKTGAAK